MAVVANQALAFDKSILTHCRHLADLPKPTAAPAGSRANWKLAESSRRCNVRVDHLGISGGRIRANNTGGVFHP